MQVSCAASVQLRARMYMQMRDNLLIVLCKVSGGRGGQYEIERSKKSCTAMKAIQIE